MCSLNNHICSQIGKRRKFVNFAHINAESVVSHIDEIREMFKDNIFDVIAISETFLKPGITSESVKIQNYNWIRNDRVGLGRGGVALLVHSKLAYKVLFQSPSAYSKSPEYIIIELAYKTCKMVVGVVYRPPKIGKINEVFDEVAKLSATYEHIVLLGDFNADMLSDNAYSRQLTSILNSLNFSYLPLGPTHHSANSSTLLDLILVRSMDVVSNFGQSPASGLSRHDLIYCSLNLKSVKSGRRRTLIRDMKRFNRQDFIREALLADWDQVYKEPDINRKLEIFNSIILTLFDKHCPWIEVKSKYQPAPWINEDIRSEMKNRDKLYKQYLLNKSNQSANIISINSSFNKYKKVRNKVKQMIRNAKTKYYYDIFSSDKNSTEFWKIVRRLGIANKGSQDEPLIVSLDSLNEHFTRHTIQSSKPEVIEYYASRKFSGECFKMPTVSQETVKECLKTVKSTSVGADGISAEILRILGEVIAPVLTSIFNASLSEGIYPDVWKKAIIKPIPKVKSPVNVNDFRAISLLCTAGKMLDKIVYLELNSYVEKNNMLDHFQSAYRTGFSTETALVKVLDDVRRSMDQRQVTIMVMVDFSSAFDLIRHDILLGILRSIGIEGSSLNWFDSYLSGREQRVKGPGGHCSTWKKVEVGSPQGSVLSALIFIIYIKTLSSTLSRGTRHIMYADDLQLYRSCPVDAIGGAVSRLSEDLDNLLKWCSGHGMKINENKTKAMVLGYSKIIAKIDFSTIPKVICGEIPLDYVDTMKNLGIMMQSNFSWNSQVTAMCNSVFKGIYQLRRLASDFPTHVRKQLAQSLILPVFDYAPVATCDFNSEDIARLQKAQNALVRFVLRLKLDDHVTQHYKSLGWLKIKERKRLHIAVLVFKILKFKRPQYLYEEFSFMAQVHSKDTRNRETLLQIPKHRTNLFNRSFIVQGTRIYNELVGSFNFNEKTGIFREKLKKQLLETY